MTWLTWRQFRTQAYIAAAALVVVAVGMVLNSHRLGDLWVNSGAATCTAAGNCQNEVTNFLDEARRGLTSTLFTLSLIFMYVLPPLIGVFWGAPMIARELESGTHRLVWNQSVTPQRWLAVKLATIGVTAVAAAGVFSTLVTWAARHPDQATGDRIAPMLFNGRGLAPVAYTAFAFALGVAVGALLRRTIPAMAVTLGVYLAAFLSSALFLRVHLLPARHFSTPLTEQSIKGVGVSEHGGAVEVYAGRGNVQGWVLHVSTTDSSGNAWHGPAVGNVCGPDAPFHACQDWVTDQHLQQRITYLPESRFWDLQFAEAGIFLAAALLLVGFTFWWLRRRTV